MKGLSRTTTYEEFKELLKNDLRLEKIGSKKSKFTKIINLNIP